MTPASRICSPFLWKPHSLLSRYSVAILCSGGAVGLRWLLDPLLDTYIPFGTTFGFVALAVWKAGWAPALLSAFLSYLACDWLFIEPRYVFDSGSPMLWGGVAYLFSVLVIIAIGEAMRRAQHQAQLHAAVAVEKQRILEVEVNERKRVEHVLRESEARTRIAQQAARWGVFEYDYATGKNYWSPELEALYGLKPGTFDGTYEGWRRYLHPADREGAERAMQNAMERGEYSHDYRVIWDDGSVHWLYARAKVYRDHAGRPQRMLGVNVDITERKLMEEALRERESELEAIVNRTPFLLTRCTRDLRYHFVSRAYAKMIGRAPEDVVGKPIIDILGNAGFRTILPHVAQVLQGHRVEYESDVQFEGIGMRSLHVVYIPDKDLHGNVTGWIASILDITGRKEAEKALRESEARFRTMADVSPVIIWVTDSNGCIEFINRAYETFCGMSEHDVQELRWKFVIHPDDRDEYMRAFLKCVREQTAFTGKCRIKRADGEWRWIASYGAPRWSTNGKFLGHVGSSPDIHELITAQQAVRDSEAQLRSFAGGLEQLVAERTEELMQSQERLRGLASELNLAEQRERKRLATELHDHLQQLLVLGRLKLGQGKHLTEAIPAAAKLIQQTDEVLTEALAYTRSLVAELSPPVLREHGLIAGLKWLGEWMRRHEIEVTVEAENETFGLPEEQAMLLFQSVRELLINAAKHARANRAWVVVTHSEGYLHIMVKDEGAGFSLTAVPRTDAAGGSSKFGLLSVRERMKALGGSLAMESTPGKGTTAMLTLPLAAAAGAQVPRAESSPSTPDHRLSATGAAPDHSLLSSTKLRVLLVDDHAMMRQGLRSVLESYPEVEIVGEGWNGEEAVSLVQTLQPSVVVMDINMPKLNGIEATARIKAQFPHMAIIGLSVNSDSDNQEAMRKAGAAMLMTKEAAVDELYQAIQSVLKRPPVEATIAVAAS